MSAFAGRVVVVGGGIAGLAAAFALSRELPEAQITVLEASGVIGGKLRVGKVAGVGVDVGAEALLARRPEGVALIRDVGLEAARMWPLTTAAQVRVGGGRFPLPAKTCQGIPSDVGATRESGALTEPALARVAAEPSADPLPRLVDDIAVGALVRSRLGNEVLDRLVEPLLGGVYAGRADELSLRATMPALADHLEREGGSLVLAARAVNELGARARSAGPVFTSLCGGLGTLPDEIVRRGRFLVRTSTTVRGVRRTPGGFAVECGTAADPDILSADAIVLATPAAKTALLLRELAPAAARELGSVDTASVAIVTLAYRDVRPPPGSGLLVGAREGFGVKAVTLSSQKWPMETGDMTILRASLGRAGQAQILQREDSDLVGLVRHELRSLIDVDAGPIDAIVTRWGGGLPQYAVGHVEMVARVRQAVADVPGLAVCGASYDGIGIPACIASAQAAVARIVASTDRIGASMQGRGE
ncbi:MAG: protoporphyrinogen oxidase [Actinomycetota bacterium]|nr:protoporphyrinogen oxidase [Actinomycetota bacterium]